MNKTRRSNRHPNVQAQVVSEIPHLRRYAQALLTVRRADQADDLVQACLEKALRNIDSWRGQSNMRAWLFSVMHNLFVSELRKRRPRLVFGVDESHQTGYSPLRADSHVTLNDVEKALRALPVEQHEVVVMVGLEGLSYEEVAHALQIPVGTVRSRLSRGREALRGQLSPDDIAAA